MGDYARKSVTTFRVLFADKDIQAQYGTYSSNSKVLMHGWQEPVTALTFNDGQLKGTKSFSYLATVWHMRTSGIVPGEMCTMAQ